MAPVKKRATRSKHHVSYRTNLPGSAQEEQRTKKMNDNQGESATDFSKMMNLLSKSDNSERKRNFPKTEGIKKEKVEVEALKMQNDLFNSWCFNDELLKNSDDINQEISPSDSVSKTLLKSGDIFESQDAHYKSFKQVKRPEKKSRKYCDQIKRIAPVPERISSTETIETEVSYDCLKKGNKNEVLTKEFVDESHEREKDTVFRGGLSFGDFFKKSKDQTSSTSIETSSSVETCISNVTAKNMDEVVAGTLHQTTCYPSSKKNSDEKLLQTSSKAKVKHTASYTQQDNGKTSRARSKSTSRTKKTQVKSSGLKTAKRVLCVGAAWASPAIIACYLIARICGYSSEDFANTITKKAKQLIVTNSAHS